MDARALASPSRRHFLTATAAVGGGLLLGFGLPVRSEVRDTLTTNAPFAPNAFLRIDRAGKVTFVSPMIEMGQGTYTSLPMLVAEELEVDVDRVAIEHSPADDKVYVNPLIGIQMTGASTAIRGMYVPLRRAGATARVLLVTAAAQRWMTILHLPRAERNGCTYLPGRGSATERLSTPPRAAGAEKVALRSPPTSSCRKAAPAPRQRRQGQRQGEVRHRCPATRDEVRRGGGLPDLRWQPPLRR
jgi:isoquinoline 1-oxidoreductase beta subunit